MAWGRGALSNATWACFDHRRVARAHPTPRCSECGEPMTLVGVRLRVPKRHDDRGWKKLHEMLPR